MIFSAARIKRLFIILGSLSVLFLLIGCGEDSGTDSISSDLLTANKDVSEVVASSVAADNGGVVDQLVDLAAIAMESDSLAAAKLSAMSVETPFYDSTTGTWRLQFTRQRGEADGPFHAMFTRTYTYQYRNRNGEPQKQWRVGSDTAYSIQFEISDGSGQCRTLRLCQQVISMNGNWLVTGVNTDTLFINGTYECSGFDTLKSYKTVRLMQYQLNLMFKNVRCLRGKSLDITDQIKGDLSGTFQANVLFVSGYTYGETNLYRNMNVTMANGDVAITIGSEKYTGDLATGEL